MDSLPIHFFFEQNQIIIWRYKTISELMINEQIKDKEVRLIGPDGEQLGIVSSREALKRAEEAELDLVKIAPKAKPPVCKIIDYGKYRYELARKEKEAKKKQKVTELKEIRITPNIEQHDFDFKAKNIRKFIEDGNKVKVTVRFRGRELNYVKLGEEALNKFIDNLSDIATPDKKAILEGKNMFIILSKKTDK